MEKCADPFGEKTYFSVSATTRLPRPGEVDGVDYLFVTKEKFEEMIAAVRKAWDERHA